MASTTVSKNKQGYGYKYADLSEIHSYLESINMRYYQYIEPYGDNAQNDYVYTVPIQILPDGTEKELKPRRGCRVIQATLSGKSNPAQENGSAITYARRYSLLMAFGLATDDDDGARYDKKNNEKSDEQKNKEMADSVDKSQVPSGEGITEERLAKLYAEMNRTGITLKTILATAQVKELKEMKEETYIAVMNKLHKTPDKKDKA